MRSWHPRCLVFGAPLVNRLGSHCRSPSLSVRWRFQATQPDLKAPCFGQGVAVRTAVGGMQATPRSVASSPEAGRALNIECLSRPTHDRLGRILDSYEGTRTQRRASHVTASWLISVRPISADFQ